MRRILKPGGRMVVFTADPRNADENCWLKEYFKPQFQMACDVQPPQSSVIAQVESLFGTAAVISQFFLPPDLTDGFFYSAWRYPEKYLDKNFRKGISCFAMCDGDPTESVIVLLRSDLESGAWDTKYGSVRKQDHYDGGYYFFSIEK
jgi:hypothetical protein